MRKWIASEIHEQLAVVARASRVKSLETVSKQRFQHGQGSATSKLLMVKVNWRTPIFGLDHIVVIVGVLHNTEAKKPKAKGYTAFFDALADLCAGGGRIVGADLNMAAHGAVEEMAKRGVGLALVCHHREMEKADDDYSTRRPPSSMIPWACGSSANSTSSGLSGPSMQSERMRLALAGPPQLIL